MTNSPMLQPGQSPETGQRTRRGAARGPLLLTLILLLLGSMVLSVAVGSVSIPASEVLDAVWRA
ncbi:hypothetical protein [Deinococcus radiophilus]|uniref:hypothetical protein n=1 Tax=Deinococcus radiophilus TaxID=32062 RepID=UPI00360D7D78